MTGWEYKKVGIDYLLDERGAITIEKLNMQGEFGWQLCAFSYVGGKLAFAYFKRPIE